VSQLSGLPQGSLFDSVHTPVTFQSSLRIVSEDVRFEPATVAPRPVHLSRRRAEPRAQAAANLGGGIVRIIPEADAKLHSSPTYGQSDQARVGGDRIETRVFTLKYESATQMLPVLRPLIAPNNAITAYQNSNTLVITDYANNLQRLEKIIDSIDQPSGSDPVSIPLQYVSAVDTAVTVSSPVRGGGRGASDQTRCQPHSLRVCQGQRRRCH
jgi:type II secretory pathway component GspD/PulD (secretin)